MSRVRETLEVYKHLTPYRDAPDAEIPFAEGKLCVERGDADFVKRGTAIRLRRKWPAIRAGSPECDKHWINVALGALRNAEDHA
jgi:hypothetical protein